MSNNYDISLVRGTDYSLYIQYLNEDNTPVDLNNSTGKLSIKKFAGSEFELVSATETGITCMFIVGVGNTYTTFTGGSGICFNTNQYKQSGNTGDIYITLPKEITKYIPEGRHLYNLILGLTSGKQEFLSGKFVCVENIGLPGITGLFS